jgi:aspartate beta-hydroxylase
MNRIVSVADLQTAWRDGARALREGRAGEAATLFQHILDAGDANAAVWTGVAMARRGLADLDGERQALEQVLRLEPRNIRALLMKADNYAAAGEEKAAASFYDAVLKLAANGSVDPSFRSEIARAEQALAGYANAYGLALTEALGDLERPEARRARRALDLLLGKSQLYLQQPKGFYFPELPNVEYADRAAFPWMDRVEAATDDIRAELTHILEEDAAAFAPYMEAESDRPSFDDHGMLGDPGWSAFYLWRGGEPVPENLARCPATAAALAEVPLCRVPGRTPSILFSLLQPGARIPPHHGFTNARFICHLPLIVPEGCAMRVGSETRHWREGQACLFDDSIEHEAWNSHPDRLRVVLIFDVWRPELTADERQLVSSLLEAADRYGLAGPLED